MKPTVDRGWMIEPNTYHRSRPGTSVEITARMIYPWIISFASTSPAEEMTAVAVHIVTASCLLPGPKTIWTGLHKHRNGKFRVFIREKVRVCKQSGSLSLLIDQYKCARRKRNVPLLFPKCETTFLRAYKIVVFVGWAIDSCHAWLSVNKMRLIMVLLLLLMMMMTMMEMVMMTMTMITLMMPNLPWYFIVVAAVMD